MLPLSTTIVSVGGSAAAANLITSEDIQDDTIMSVDVHNGRLTDADVSNNGLTRGAVAEESSSPTTPTTSSTPNATRPPTRRTSSAGPLSFTLGRSMPVIAFWNYAFGNAPFSPGSFTNGECQPRVDGAATATVVNQSEDDADFSLGVTPIVDVVQLDAGNHTVNLWCSERTAGNFVVRDVRIGVIELGLDVAPNRPG
jgi:hypothetical protein